MPERWERELSKLRDMEAPGPEVRRRIEGGPRSNEGPPRHDRVLAALVAVAVAVVAGGFLWRTLPGTSGGTGDPAAALPTLTVRFEQNGLVVDEPDEQIPRVDTTIVYGDAREESFTSALPANDDFTIRWVAAEDLTPLVPGPTVGSAIDFQADGVDPRVLLGRPEDWPNFDRFTRIDRLPEEPGQYILVFQADYPGGIARTPRLVQLVEPGVLQLVLRETGDEQALSGDVYVDGRGAEGFLSETSFTEGDAGPLEKAPEAPTFSPEAWLEIESGSPVMLVTPATTATSGTFDSYDSFVPGADLPNDLLAGAATIEGSGRVLLAVEATWVHPAPGPGESATSERALFFFPIEVDTEPLVEEPVPPSASPESVGEGTVAIDIRRSAEGDPEVPRAVASLGEQDIRMCPNGWSLVGKDGERNEVLFDCGQEEEFIATAGTPAVVTGDFASVDVSARVHGDRTQYAANQVPGIDAGSLVTFTYVVEWDDGSEASFWLQVQVSDGSPTAAASILKIRCGPGGAEILTPVVIAQPDGVHIEVDNAAGAAALDFGSFGGPIDGAVRAWPIQPGSFFVACLERASDTHRGPGTARFEVIDPNGYWVPGTPECAEGDPLLKIQAYDGGGADYVDDEAAIRGILHSVEPSDEVRLPFYPEGSGSKDLRYVVVRDGRVVAYVFVRLSDEEDPYGAGLTEVTGEACASSGIAQGSLS